MRVEPYLNFDGRCEEAIQFYKTAVGAEVTSIMRYKECPDPCSPGMIPPGGENKVMHASFRIGDSTIMASDCHCKGNPNFQGISLSLLARDDDAAKRLFTSLSDGGKVAMPLTKTFFSSQFGVVNDRFGITWMIVVPQEDWKQ